MQKKIYVAIASYRDPFLQSTIDSLLENADHPENITVGCFINAHDNEIEDLTPVGNNIHYEFIKAGTAFSINRCRSGALKWLDTSYSYVLQIDSHTRFDRSWDSILINEIEQVSSNKPVISGSMPSFFINNGVEEKEILDKFRSYTINDITTLFKFLESEDICSTSCYLEGEGSLVKYWYISGAFIFAPSSYFLSVKTHEWILFWGEELINSVESFLNGWDVYIMKGIPVYHLFSEIDLYPRIWLDFKKEFYSHRKDSTKNIIDFFNSSPKSIKTIEEFYDEIGYDLGKMLNGWVGYRKNKIYEADLLSGWSDFKEDFDSLIFTSNLLT